MKTRVKINPETKNRYHVHYLHMGHTTTHAPCTNNKGIHCVGDNFGYIVDWQITEKREKSYSYKID